MGSDVDSAYDEYCRSDPKYDPDADSNYDIHCSEEGDPDPDADANYDAYAHSSTFTANDE